MKVKIMIKILRLIGLIITSKMIEILRWSWYEIIATFKPEPYIFICNNFRFLHNLPLRITLNHLKYANKEQLKRYLEEKKTS